MDQLYIGELKEAIEPSVVEEYFLQFGPIRNVRMHGRYGFVTADREVIERILGAETHIIEGQAVKVEMARGKKDEEVCKHCNRRMSSERVSRLILENVPKDIDISELYSFVMSKGVRDLKSTPENSVRILNSGDAMVEFKTKEGRDEGLRRLDGESLMGETIAARMGRRKTRL